MAEPNQSTKPNATRLRAAAVCASAVVVLLIGIQLAAPELTVLNAVVGLARTAAAVLWILWFFARYVDRKSIAYSIGYVEGVTRRYPNSDSTDLARIARMDN